MGKYIFKRILSGLITIVVLITCCFFLMHAIPGSPFSKGEKNVPESVMQRLNEKYGLDQPLHKQYFRYMENILHGDFGVSYKNSSVQVNDLISRGFPVSARIGILAVAFSVVIGIALGIISAIKRGSLFDDSKSFYDGSHMSDTGARVFSAEFAEVLKMLENGESIDALFYSTYDEAKEALPYAAALAG